MREKTTLGLRIQEGRRAAGLSQEALGEQLGVSRQAVSKWEADAAIPELENLISMSRIFGLSVGQLLGVEPPARPEDSPQEAGRELTEEQLRMVREIVDGYLAAQPEKKKSPWGKWDVRILFALCGVMLALLSGLSVKVTQLDRQYDALQSSVGSISSSVNGQINSLTQQMSNILEEKNYILANYQIVLVDYDLARETVTLRVSASPKEWTDSTTALFTAALSDGRQITAEADSGQGTFTAQDWVIPMDPTISLSVTLMDGGSARTGTLETLHDCLPGNFRLDVSGAWGASWSSFSDEVHFAGLDLDISSSLYPSSGYAAELAPSTVELCLYRNRETSPEQVIPVTEAVPLFHEAGYVNMRNFTGYQASIQLSGGDTVVAAVRITDNHGLTSYTVLGAFRCSGGSIDSIPSYVYVSGDWQPGDSL